MFGEMKQMDGEMKQNLLGRCPEGRDYRVLHLVILLDIQKSDSTALVRIHKDDIVGHPDSSSNDGYF